jgi:hypothetical protein
MRRALRLPILVLLPLLVLAAVVVEADRDDAAVGGSRPEDLAPTAPEPGTLSSTWYCPAGTATGVTTGEGAGVAEQRVVVANASDTDVSGTLTIYPAGASPVEVPIDVVARARSELDVADHVEAAWAAVLVETEGGEVTVAQELTGPSGRAAADCTSTPSADWWFPAGSSNRASQWLALFNPFPGEATVDVTFDTDEGIRTSQDYEGIVVPGGTVVVKKVSDTITVRNHIATHVSSRSGRIVAEQVLSLDGTEGTPTGLTATVGAPAAAPIWTFPASPPPGDGAAESVAIFNPGDTDADVLVQVQLEDPAESGSVEPFGPITVPAGRYQVVNVSGDQRVPPGTNRWIVVQAQDGVEVVAQRTVSAGEAGGIATTIGLPVQSTRWLAPLGATDGTNASLLAVANPSPVTTATVTVRRRDGGTVQDVPGAVELSVAPGDVVVIDLVAAGLPADGSAEVASDVPVVVGQWMSFSEPSGVATLMGIPVAGTQSLITDVIQPGVGAGLDPDEIAPSDPLGTVPGDTPDDSGGSSSTAAG